MALLLLSALACPVHAAPEAVETKPAEEAKPTPKFTAPQGGKLEAELIYKATVGTSSEIRDVLMRGGKPDIAYNTESVPALSLAAQRKDIDAISVMGAMITGGANINIKDGYGRSPLFYAAKAGLVDNVKYLLEKGASYYQTDNNGYIARTIAHNEGYEQVVKLMDNFVATQTQSVMTAYAERDKKVEEQYQKRADQQVAAAAAQAKAEAQKQEQRQPQPKSAPASKKKEVDEYQLKKLVYDLSYHSCAAAYWEFCRSNRIASPLGHEGIKTQLEAHEILAKTASQQLSEEAGASKKYIERIAAPSVKNLLDQFKSYPTNAHLKSAGVGEKGDMDQRCGFIAESWDVAPKKGKRR